MCTGEVPQHQVFLSAVRVAFLVTCIAIAGACSSTKPAATVASIAPATSIAPVTTTAQPASDTDTTVIVAAEHTLQSGSENDRSALLALLQHNAEAASPPVWGDLGTLIPDSKDAWFAAERFDGSFLLEAGTSDATITSRVVHVDGSSVEPPFNGAIWQMSKTLGTLWLGVNGSVERRDNAGKTLWSTKPTDSIAIITSGGGLDTDQPKLFSAFRDGTVTTTDLRTGAEQGRFSRPGYEPVMLAASHDSSALAMNWKGEGWVEFRDPTTGAVRGAPVALYTISQGMFTPDGKDLIVGTVDGFLSVINVDARTAVTSTLPSHLDRVVWLSMSEDGKTLLSVGADHTARLISYPSMHPIGQSFQTLNTDQLPYGIATLSADGKRLALPSADGVVAIDLSAEAMVRLACRQATRNLTATEWGKFFPGTTYHRTCPGLPA